MPNFNGDVVFVDTSGQVRSQSGDLTLRADSTNSRDVIVGSGKALRPDRDFAINLGDTFLRWNNVYATSGVFNTITAHTSGTFVNLDEIDLLPSRDARRALGSLTQRWARINTASGIFNAIGAPTSGTFIESAASIVPNRTNIYALGTGNQRWANIFATSGNILNVVSNDVNTSTFFAGTAIITDLTLDNSLTFPQTPGGSFTINQQGSLTWDTQGFDVSMINLIQWDWGTASLINIATVDAVNVTASNIVDTNTLNVGPGLASLDDTIVDGTLSTTNIVPQIDRLYGIGTSAFRYSRMHAASGLFNTIGPQTSGTYVNVIGSLVPERDAIYSLGTSSLRWANIYAVSGTIPTLATTDITASNIVSTAITGVSSLVALDSFAVLGTAFMNGGTLFSNAAAPGADAVFTMGLQGLRFSSLYAVSGFIETITPLPSGGFLTVNGSILPDLDLMRGLGSNSDRRWATVSAGSGIFTTRATIKDTPVVTTKDARTTVHAVITANSGAIINSNAERDIYNYTIPANTLSASGKLMLECIGSFTNMAGANVNLTPRVYINGTAIWGDVLAVSQGPRAADFALYAEICALGSLTGQRVRGTVELATRTAGSITGNGDFATANGGVANWSSQATSGTVDFSTPVTLRVSMQLGTASTNASYSGFQCILSHQPFPTLL